MYNCETVLHQAKHCMFLKLYHEFCLIEAELCVSQLSKANILNVRTDC
jgi:hypothetical protein